MIRCFICNEELTEQNSSVEHIILNSIGGRLKSKTLLCKTCNNKFHNTIDYRLSEQLKEIGNYLQIKKERKDNNASTKLHFSSSNKDYLLKNGILHPIHTFSPITYNENGIPVKIIAKSKTEFIDIIKGLARKHPNIDIEKSINDSKETISYINEPIQMQLRIGYADEFRAVCKCAIEYYLFHNGEASYIKHLIPYIEKKEPKQVVSLYSSPAIYSLEKNEVLHILHLVGNKDKHILYCYVDFFNTWRYIVLLSDLYNGKDINKTYVYDLLEQKEIERPIRLELTLKECYELVNCKSEPDLESYKQNFQRLMNIAENRQLRTLYNTNK